MSRYFLKTFLMYARSRPVRRCLNGSVFPLFKQLLETEMTLSHPIIVKEFILKNKNECFASR